MKLLRDNGARPIPRPVIIEMGGKNPAIITAKADLDKASDGVLSVGVRRAGTEVLGLLARLRLEGACGRNSWTLLVEKTKKIKVGNPLEKDVWMGPVVNEGALKTFEEAVARAKEDGGKILVGGNRMMTEPFNHGYFVEPTIIDGLPKDHALFKEELFVPITVVADVIDPRRSDRARERHRVRPDRRDLLGRRQGDRDVLRRIQAGVTYANRRSGATTGAWPGINPFGGWKASGATGRGTGGPWYVQQFMREQSRVRIKYDARRTRRGRKARSGLSPCTDRRGRLRPSLRSAAAGCGGLRSSPSAPRAPAAAGGRRAGLSSSPPPRRITPFSRTQSCIIFGETRPGFRTLPLRQFRLPAASVRDMTRPAPWTVENSDSRWNSAVFSEGCSTLDDHRIVAHRPANESLLARKRRRRSLANNDHRLSLVLFAPGEVVVVVDQFQLRPAEDRDDLARDPFAAGVGVLAGKRHQRPVVLPDRRVERQEHLTLGHARTPLVSLDIARNPDATVWPKPRLPKWTPTQMCTGFVGKDVDVVIAAADRTELRARLAPDTCPGVAGQRVPGRALEQHMIDRRIV